MFGKKKPSQSEIDGVQYRRAKMWQIILYACNALVGMSVYSLINMASYSASIGYGISTAAVGVILTCTRILDGVTAPRLAFGYDRVTTPTSVPLSAFGPPPSTIWFPWQCPWR